jgi:predicted PilT family ATPase
MKRFKSYLTEFKVEYPDSKKTLGIPRDKMPQVKSKDYDELIDFLSKKKISLKLKSVKARDLKATQSNFNVDKIVKAASKYSTLAKAKPIIVSSDGYVIDGHHRWLGALNIRGNVSIMQANVKAKELLSAINEFPKTFNKNIDET